MGLEQIYTPQSQTGITSFKDSTGSAIIMDPKLVVGFTIAFIILEFALRFTVGQ
ncbi:preprotein translocase subunit Sec61beta [Candidatus Micrarchaeota archaeon]|nr:preprotein translocase subunit Sec61beta [Candidatus Micrarchaeota archaeon]